MALADLTSRDPVLAAIREFESLGRDEFLTRYGFGRSRDYELFHEGSGTTQRPLSGQRTDISIRN